MAKDSIGVALLVTDMLERLSIAYAVEGSLANSEYGIARSTLEARIIADMQPEHVAPFVSALSRDFYVDHHMIDEAISGQGTFTLVHYATKFNVDVVIPRQRPFDQMQLKRRSASVISTNPPRQVSVTTLEDAILSKLERYHGGGRRSLREWRDIVGLMQSKVGHLDLVYLRHWAADLGVTDLLERALKEA
jgi:hypothetical protein